MEGHDWQRGRNGVEQDDERDLQRQADIGQDIDGVTATAIERQI